MLTFRLLLTVIGIIILIGALPALAEPSVTATAPARNSIGVSADADIIIIFSEAMNPETIDANSFVVTGNMTGKNSPHSLVYDPVLFKATYDPTQNFLPGELVTVILTTSNERRRHPGHDRLQPGMVSGIPPGVGWMETLGLEGRRMGIDGRRSLPALQADSQG